jgi:hypothetical protein
MVDGLEGLIQLAASFATVVGVRLFLALKLSDF